tara:strand:- start:32 stop:1240 length:1209 start_codon:yes stop_codon:yes gene_type:complete
MRQNLPLIFLTTFGHCGIDWVHSLLNSNRQILITPAFSFFRVFKELNLKDINNNNLIFERLKNYFINKVGPKSTNKQKKFLQTDDELEVFLTLLKKEIKKNNCIKIVDFFWIIHNCYIKVKNINPDSIKVIVSHEHLPWHFEDIIKEFPTAKIMIVMRDPRASIAGLFHGRKKTFGFLPDYTFNETFEIWMHAQEMYFKYKEKYNNKLLVIKNENMHRNLKKELLTIVKWLGVDYSDSMLIGTYSDGSITKPDTLYKNTEDPNFIYNKYYLPENIEKRWREELNGTHLVVIIESILFKIMNEFKYEIENRKNYFLLKFKGYLLFLAPNKSLLFKWEKTYPNLDEFQKVETVISSKIYSILLPIWKIIPNKIKYFLIYCRSIFSRLKIIFFPGKRYNRYKEVS